MPSGMAIRMDRKRDEKVISSVGPMRWAISSQTACPVRYEVPRFPWSICPSQRRYCTITG